MTLTRILGYCPLKFLLILESLCSDISAMLQVLISEQALSSVKQVKNKPNSGSFCSEIMT
jgi:hypothetical protein